LAQLHQQSGDWEKAAESLERVASTAPQPADRAAAFLAMGELYRDHLNKPAQAREAFEKALSLADLPAAAEGLLAMARADGDDDKVMELLTRKLDSLAGAERLPLLKELAELHGKRGAHGIAVPLLEEAQTLAGDDLQVSDALLDAYFAADRHADAMPLLTRIIEQLKAARRNREVFRYNYRLGCVAEAQGDDDRALAAYTACFDFDATYVPNLVRLAKMHYRREDWDKALKVYQTTLLHQMKLDKSDRVDVFYHLGMVRIARGEARQAKNMFTRALSQNPDHAPSKQALADLSS
jgi:tetratricopeptide (TPR) repeat protein